MTFLIGVGVGVLIGFALAFVLTFVAACYGIAGGLHW